jgi:hypothetical protein
VWWCFQKKEIQSPAKWCGSSGVLVEFGVTGRALRGRCAISS